MGVPVVSLAGPTHVSRVGLSLLSAIGAPELAAASEDEYVRIAAELAGDRPRLLALRAGLRERMRASPLCDERAYVARLEGFFRRAWRERCGVRA